MTPPSVEQQGRAGSGAHCAPHCARHDNTSLPIKLELRRRLLLPFSQKHPLRVMDLCAGNQQIWRRLRSEFKVAQYVAFDQKRVPGAAVRVDSARWIRDVGLSGNVIDVDTYGEPWAQYLTVLAAHWPDQEVLIFLTLGMGKGALGRISRKALEVAGLKGSWQSLIPPACNMLREIIVSSCLTRGCDKTTIPLSACRAQPEGSNTWYFGVWLRRGKGDANLVRRDGTGPTAAAAIPAGG